MKEGILIVSYTFPPNMAIGGKRWYKFACQFFDKGFDVHIISSEKSKMENRVNQVLIKDFKMYYLRDKYPDWFFQQPKNFLEKIRYKLFQFFLFQRSKGTIYDKSIFLQNEINQIVTKVIKENKIRLVIVTSPPFYISSFIAELRKKNEFKLICDFRDPWTWGESYGYENLSQNRLAHDKKLERGVIQTCDLIISPAKSIVLHLKSSYAEYESKIYHIPHGLDSSITLHSENKKSSYQSRFKFVYAGTLYNDYDRFLDKLCAVINRFPSETFDQFRFDIFALNQFDHYKAVVDRWKMNDKIFFHKRVEESELNKKLNQYDGSIIFFPPKYKDFLSTKFIELIALRIPIIYIGEKGEVADFLESNQLGVHLEMNDFPEKFEKKIQALKDEYNFNFDVSNYFFSVLTDRILEISNYDLKK